jgi:hypothetical protein
MTWIQHKSAFCTSAATVRTLIPCPGEHGLVKLAEARACLSSLQTRRKEAHHGACSIECRLVNFTVSCLIYFQSGKSTHIIVCVIIVFTCSALGFLFPSLIMLWWFEE